MEATVIAQGIEAGAEFEAARDCGSDYGQGFLFAPLLKAPGARPEVGRQTL
jgi:EAL domain-containing protein (putative c-di-GMP-specific phosphodiesterase class I)